MTLRAFGLVINLGLAVVASAAYIFAPRDVNPYLHGLAATVAFAAWVAAGLLLGEGRV
jgi:hypothetical protein